MTLSSLLRTLLHRPSTAAPSPAAVSLAHLSSYTGRPRTGDGGDRRRGRAVEENDPFGQDFNFGSDDDDDLKDRGRGRRGRPSRESASSRGWDFGGDGDMGSGRPPKGGREFSGRPMRGEGRYSADRRPGGGRMDGMERMGNGDGSRFSRPPVMNGSLRKETRWNAKDDDNDDFLSLEKLGIVGDDEDGDVESRDSLDQLGEKVQTLGADEGVDQTVQSSVLEGEKNEEGKAKKSLRECLSQAQEEASREADSGPPPEADEIFKKMKETGLIPNAVAMLDGLCKDGLVKEAMNLFGLMREKGTIPEVVVYTAVVEGFCKAAKFDDAKRVFRKMQSNGIVPNAFSYRVLVQGLCKGKKLEESVEFCVEMLEAGHLPNPATFVGLVDLACSEGGGEEAMGAIRRLRDKGFAYDDKAVREHLDKKGPFNNVVREAILGKKNLHKLF